MKKLVLGVMISLMTVSFVFASPCYKCPPGPQGEQGEQGVQGEKGEQGPEASNDKDSNWITYGVGADVMLVENKAKTVGFETQYRYDQGRDAHAVFGVVKVNLWEILTKKK